MKNTLIAIAVAATSVTAASAQTSVSWDFSQFAFEGFSSVDGATLTGVASANYLDNSSSFVGAAAIGTMYYDGNFGSTAFNLGAQEVSPAGALDLTLASNGSLGTLGERTSLGIQGQAATNAFGYGLATNGSFTFGLDGYTADQLQFAAVNSSDGSTSILWETSTDGVSFVQAGTSAVTTGATEFFVDVTGASFVRGTVSGLDGGLFGIDNVTLSGLTVVPEPSTYAAIAGALALGFVAYRRRK